MDEDFLDGQSKLRQQLYAAILYTRENYKYCKFYLLIH